MKIIALIPARGGSKGIPGKNIAPFSGSPLISHSIRHALSSALIDQVYVSTDDDGIAEIAKNESAMVIRRPAEISGDTATTETAIEHALHHLADTDEAPDIVVLMQATSPLRPENAVHDALEHFILYRFDSLVSVSPTHRFFWNLDGREAHAQYDYLSRPRRQDLQDKDIPYVENGSFYIFTREHFESVGNRLGGRIGYAVLPEEYSFEIDTLLDFKILELISRQLASSSTK